MRKPKGKGVKEKKHNFYYAYYLVSPKIPYELNVFFVFLSIIELWKSYCSKILGYYDCSIGIRVMIIL